ncbi:hypothetical protein F2P81_019871 [Scophthalmus maximus]|uniref:Uncharacterized protein n=1 Tax=Scophthalmus maximus TaxID=52904 RepID=A0A6A4S6G4_SCOMX|nr:hypothetical protein F2P81_019871 [Scophthalmus maximus]
MGFSNVFGHSAKWRQHGQMSFVAWRICMALQSFERWKKSDVLPPSSSPLPVCDPPSAQCVTGAHANQGDLLLTPPMHRGCCAGCRQVGTLDQMAVKCEPPPEYNTAAVSPSRSRCDRPPTLTP